ncbi:Di-trans-poly-cis-decaprenylcistransferase [Multifurca ochricompacta]|uniref:Di-trans-poly-cis-decaprenylcistransferase n=1 Tax=Multifurca ochricompacta TaxID=376703 RepID=A0AAD4LZS0_9AGAM|nr:Di-trans-poly-cis-decaprenylcistransferase [Multifurca ochricompacta]
MIVNSMPPLQFTLWLRDKAIDSLQNALIYVLKAGPIPRHVAFVMDGNRRYARLKKMQVSQGHVDGFAALIKVLNTLNKLGVKFFSVYAFAIDNFERPKEERCDWRVRSTAKRGWKNHTLPSEVQVALAKAEELTKDNHRAVLNVFMSYSSQDEMTTAVGQTIRDALLEGKTEPITEKDIENRLLTTKVHSPPLDILIRTSGVARLSDFLLWQCTENTQIHFIDTVWPKINSLHLVPIILDYQRKVWSQSQ